MEISIDPLDILELDIKISKLPDEHLKTIKESLGNNADNIEEN